jgi:UDP-N-acetylglucosamine transferase subunit ALG13
MLECLELKKKVFAVVNESLMGNHQKELFDALIERKLITGIPSITLFSQQV